MPRQPTPVSEEVKSTSSEVPGYASNVAGALISVILFIVVSIGTAVDKLECWLSAASGTELSGSAERSPAVLPGLHHRAANAKSWVLNSGWFKSIVRDTFEKMVCPHCTSPALCLHTLVRASTTCFAPDL
eukprot:SAG31_NODE_4805_length_2945_cov_16.344694_5_plen_130_part_00